MVRELRLLKPWEKRAALRGSVMKEYPFVVLCMSSLICIRGKSGRLDAKRSLSRRIRCASVNMPWMKLF